MLNVHWIRPKKPRIKKQVFLFLHGFPGRRTRNENYAAYLTAKYQVPSLHFQYLGLGDNPGTFSFKNCIENTDKVITDLRSQGYEDIFLVAHSFGAFVALNVIKNRLEDISGAILLAPLIQMPNREQIEETLFNFCETQNALEGYSANYKLLAEESEELSRSFLPLQDFEVYKAISGRLTIIHPPEDTVVPIAGSRLFRERMGEGFELFELGDNHWFTGTEEVLSVMYNTVEKKWNL